MVLTSKRGQNIFENDKYMFAETVRFLSASASKAMISPENSFRLKTGRFFKDSSWFLNGCVKLYRYGASPYQREG